MNEQDILSILRDYAATPAGAKAILSQAPELKSDLRSAALELRKDIVKAYNSTISSNANRLTVEHINVNSIRASKSGTCWEINITFTHGVLERESLLNAIGGRTGTGVYDIFGLLTTGYPLIKRTAGIWEGRNGDLPIKNKRIRSPNPFIHNAIKNFESRHPGIRVSYPVEWGGEPWMCDEGIL